MSRDTSAAYAEALAAGTVRPFVLFEAQFASGWVRLWSGLGPLTWGGREWMGAGTLLTIGAIEETTDVVATGTSVSLSGVPLDLVSIAIAEARQGMPGRIYIGLMDAAWQVIADPVLAFTGRLDVPEIQDGADTCTVTITYESRLIDLQTPREWRYTHESQQVLYPGDKGFEYVTSIQDKDIVWGRKK